MARREVPAAAMEASARSARRSGARRLLRLLLWIVAILVALPIVLVAAVLVALNTGAGQAFLALHASPLTGGLVSLSGLSGTLPTHIRVRRIAIADTHGVWLTVDDAALDWSPAVLLFGRARVDRLSASRVDVARLPVSAPAAKPSQPFQLPLPVDVERAHVARLDMAAPVAGAPASLALDASAHLEKLFQGHAELSAHDLDASGVFRAHAVLGADRVDVVLDADDPPGGLAARFAKLPPSLGALSVRTTLRGLRDAARLDLALAAGQSRVEIGGKVDLDRQAVDLTLQASAPAMTPAPGVSFQSAHLDGHVQGTARAPHGSLVARVAGIGAAGASVADLSANLDLSLAEAALTARAEGVRLPGPHPDLLAASPVELAAYVDLRAAGRPARFDLHHPLLRLTGNARTDGPLSLTAQLEAADLAPLAAAAGVDVAGRAALQLRAAQSGPATSATVAGTLGITAGPGPVAALIGPEARLDLAAALRGQDVTLSRLSLDGRAIRITAHGGLAAGKLDAETAIDLPDLRAAAPTLSGRVGIHAQAEGRLDALSARIGLTADVATKGGQAGRLQAELDATGLPRAPAGKLAASGTLDGAPLILDATVTRGEGGAIEADIARAAWKGAHADAKLTLARGARLPTGTASLRVQSLADFRRLSGLALAGSVEATLGIVQMGAGAPVATTRVRADRAGLPGQAAIRRLALDARVEDPLGAPSLAATLAADGVRAGAIAADAHVTISGPRNALAIRADANANGVPGGAARLAARATLDMPAQRLTLASLDAEARGAALRLLQPARIAFAPAVSVDRLRLGLRGAVLDVAGRVAPTLDLTASLHHATADLARLADPSLQAEGTLDADARLTGTQAQPSGTARVAARGLRLRQGPAAGLPPANLTANATLAGRSARLDAALVAGSTRFTLAGTAPIAAGAPLDLTARGGIDLALTDPILAPAGRRARGMLDLNATVTGSLGAPSARGTLTLAGVSFEDFGQGARLSDLNGTLEAQGDHVTLTRLTGRAGGGTVAASGSIGLAAPRPVDLKLVMDRAEPVANSILNAIVSADLALRGALQGRLDAAGRVTIQRANITVPDRLPTSVAVLDVRVPGQKPPPPPAPPPTIGLDVTLSAPAVIFVRGHGLDAVLRGDLHAGGTTSQPLIRGGFDMIHGTFSFAGTSLTFTTGRVTFDGSGKLDPVLDFVATTTSGNVTANLEVTGYASDPKILLTSTPQLPQDEVLAHLLFGQPASSLSPFQLGEIALALAQLTGGPGAGVDPLGAARKALGLDRLSIAGGSGGSSGGATLQAGQYVAPGIYVGAAQGTGGGGTQAQVQIDITKGLKLNTTVGTGGGSATGSSQASSSGTGIGLTYQFQY